MKKLALAFAIVLIIAPALAQAGTVTVTTAGFANLPATPPANWPAGVTYPGAVSTNGTHAYTISDADWVRLITWTAASQFHATPAGPATPTALQILLAWVQIWWTGTQQSEAIFSTTPAVPPPPINVQ